MGRHDFTRRLPLPVHAKPMRPHSSPRAPKEARPRPGLYTLLCVNSTRHATIGFSTEIPPTLTLTTMNPNPCTTSQYKAICYPSFLSRIDRQIETFNVADLSYALLDVCEDFSSPALCYIQIITSLHCITCDRYLSLACVFLLSSV